MGSEAIHEKQTYVCLILVGRSPVCAHKPWFWGWWMLRAVKADLRCPCLCITSQHKEGLVHGCTMPVTSLSLPSGLDPFFSIALGVSAVLRPEPVGCGARPPAQERPLGCCTKSPVEMLWALHGASAAGMQLWGGCCTAREMCAAPAHGSGILAASDALLWAKRFPKATVFLIRSFCKDVKPSSIKLHSHSWKSFSWLLITFRGCLGKGACPMVAC